VKAEDVEDVHKLSNSRRHIRACRYAHSRYTHNCTAPMQRMATVKNC